MCKHEKKMYHGLRTMFVVYRCAACGMILLVPRPVLELIRGEGNGRLSYQTHSMTGTRKTIPSYQ